MIREEMKKIWRPGMVLALLFLGFVYDTLFLSYYIREWPLDQEDTGMVEVCRDLVRAYGTDLSEEEFMEFEAAIPILHKTADRYISESSYGKKHGLRTYEQYAAFCKKAVEEAAQQGTFADQEENYADAMRMHSYLLSEETGRIEGRLYAASLLQQTYRSKSEYNKDLWENSGDGYSQKELEHIKTAYYGADQMWQNILPPGLPQVAGRFAGYLLIFICICVCLLLSPLLVRDRISRMQPLQYSSRRGRNIYYCQSAAVMLSAFLVTTAGLAIYGGLFLGHGTSVFFPCRMYSFTMTQFCWPDWTHGTWCLMLLVLCYLTAFGTAGIVFFLSQGSRNYISMLLRVIPLAAALAVFCPKLTENAFYSRNPLYQYSGIPYSELLCAGILFLTGLVLWIFGALRRTA